MRGGGREEGGGRRLHYIPIYIVEDPNTALQSFFLPTLAGGCMIFYTKSTRLIVQCSPWEDVGQRLMETLNKDPPTRLNFKNKFLQHVNF